MEDCPQGIWEMRRGLVWSAHQGSSLNAMELLFIDNPSQIVEMAYLRWKRKYKTSSPE